MTYQRRQDGLLVQEVGGEVVIYDQKRDLIHSLNRTTALVWRHCDGQTSITEISKLLAKELSLPADEDLVWLTLDQLEKAHLLQEPLGKAIYAGKVSRRDSPQAGFGREPSPADARHRVHYRTNTSDG